MLCNFVPVVICCSSVQLAAWVTADCQFRMYLAASRTNGIDAWCASGHSLGGALATLAAYDIKKELLKANRLDVELLC